MTSSKTEGLKFDSGKPDLSLCPLVALEEMAKAFMVGEQKYGRHNYLKGMDVHRLVAAAMRHLMAYKEGEDLDPETGVTTHLGHALACLAMILDMKKHNTLKDTRYGRPTNADISLQPQGDGMPPLSAMLDARRFYETVGGAEGPVPVTVINNLGIPLP